MSSCACYAEKLSSNQTALIWAMTPLISTGLSVPHNQPVKSLRLIPGRSRTSADVPDGPFDANCQVFPLLSGFSRPPQFSVRIR